MTSSTSTSTEYPRCIYCGGDADVILTHDGMLPWDDQDERGPDYRCNGCASDGINGGYLRLYSAPVAQFLLDSSAADPDSAAAVLTGLDTGDRWNGAAVPYVTLAQVRAYWAMLANSDANSDGPTADQVRLSQDGAMIVFPLDDSTEYLYRSGVDVVTGEDVYQWSGWLWVRRTDAVAALADQAPTTGPTVRHEDNVCTCCALVIANGDESGCRDFHGHTHRAPALDRRLSLRLDEEYPGARPAGVDWSSFMVLTGQDDEGSAGEEDTLGACPLCGVDAGGYWTGFPAAIIR